MQKRQCDRFSIPGTTLRYKVNPRFWGRSSYSDDQFPVLDMSRGGLKFLSNHKIRAGTSVTFQVFIPDVAEPLEIKAVIRWISRNPEASYRYQNGAAFNTYGQGRKQNPEEVLTLIKNLEPTGNL